MSWWVESGVIDEGDIKNVQGWGYSMTGLRTTGIDILDNVTNRSKMPRKRFGFSGCFISVSCVSVAPSVDRSCFSVLVSTVLLNLSLPRRQLLGTRARESLGRKKVRCCLCMDECWKPVVQERKLEQCGPKWRMRGIRTEKLTADALKGIANFSTFVFMEFFTSYLDGQRQQSETWFHRWQFSKETKSMKFQTRRTLIRRKDFKRLRVTVC